MKRKSAKVLKVVSLLFVICTILCLAGCGKAVTVKISDANITTDFEANTRMTVKEILDEAGITLGEKDEVVPEAEAKLKDATEIIVKRYAKVTVKYAKEEKTVELVGGTVADAVSKAGYTLDDKIKVDAEETSYLEDGMVITLKESVEVTLKVDGTSAKHQTHAETVKDFLDEIKVTLDEDDTVSPKADKKIKAGMKIVVKRVEYKEEVRKEAIPFTTKETKTSSLSAGSKKITQKGVDGEKEVTYKVKYVDGKEESKEVISEKVIKEAVTQLVTVGTKTSSSQQSGGKRVVSKQAVYDCDGSGHGYYVITYSDGSVAYEKF